MVDLPSVARLLWPSALLVSLAVSACSVTPSPSASVTASTAPTASPSGSPTPLPTSTPEPPLSLALPSESDPRSIIFAVAVQSDLAATTSGHVVVTVTNRSDSTVAELVLRWPTALKEIISLAPFEPTDIRIGEGGLVLYQEWTKWVEGPGEMGEPSGTTSLGWGPLLPGATLTITLTANRIANQPSAFDLQFLAGEAILSTEAGPAAELRVALP
jgi:hypothetical protein